MSDKKTGMTPTINEGLAAFESAVVRRTWHEGQWWFAIVNVVAALTDSQNPEGYLKDLRRRDNGLAEGWGQIATPLRMATPGGPQLLNSATVEGVLRIIQPIPSPQAEPFKRWLAQVGYERIQEAETPLDFDALSEGQRRLLLRDELSRHNKDLAAAAKRAGVETPVEYAVFQNHGYQGLYGGMGQKQIHARKGLKKSQKILDHMGSTELAANLFRATQTEEKLNQLKGTEVIKSLNYLRPLFCPLSAYMQRAFNSEAGHRLRRLCPTLAPTPQGISHAIHHHGLRPAIRRHPRRQRRRGQAWPQRHRALHRLAV